MYCCHIEKCLFMFITTSPLSLSPLISLELISFTESDIMLSSDDNNTHGMISGLGAASRAGMSGASGWRCAVG